MSKENTSMEKLKKMLNLFKPIKPVIVFILEIEASIAKCWASSVHKRLFWAEWGIPNNPEFFDHHIDLYHQWTKKRQSFWLERGVYGSLALKRGGKALELSCGDGFNARNFYSGIVESIIACDFDVKAMSTARRKNSAPNLTFILSDIRVNMPNGQFDNIIWDAAIEHFTPDEINSIMLNIKKRLCDTNGILSGYTIVERIEGKSLEQHEYEFKDMADLKKFLTPYFKNVIVFETLHSNRHNLYFWASDGIIPFSRDWGHWLKSEE